MDEAERLCDRVAVIDSGRVVAIDTPTGLIARTNAYVIPVSTGVPLSSLRTVRAGFLAYGSPSLTSRMPRVGQRAGMKPVVAIGAKHQRLPRPGDHHLFR